MASQYENAHLHNTSDDVLQMYPEFDARLSYTKDSFYGDEWRVSGLRADRLLPKRAVLETLPTLHSERLSAEVEVAVWSSRQRLSMSPRLRELASYDIRHVLVATHST
jgi:hypothetical protein